jgi:hypothetical protein
MSRRLKAAALSKAHSKKLKGFHTRFHDITSSPPLRRRLSREKEGTSVATTITRKPLVIEDAAAVSLDLDQQLANDAWTILGYGPAKALRSDLDVRASRKHDLEILRDIFTALEIVPLDTAAVIKYKEETAKAANRNARLDTQFKWASILLPNYKAPIPQFVLANAVNIARALKEKLPNAQMQFYVEELQSFSRPDPFLYLLINGQFVCYLDVWDEPSFEGRRTV